MTNDFKTDSVDSLCQIEVGLTKLNKKLLL